MKRGILIFGLLLCIIALQCTTDQQLAGGSEVVGKWVSAANKQPVDKAVVYANHLKDSSNYSTIDSSYSDANGNYKFENLDTGLYNIEAKATASNGDTLYGFIAHVHNVTMLASKGQSPNRFDLGIDTMHLPGKIKGRVILEAGDIRPIDCYIPGTSYIAKSNDSGEFVISSIPPGIYSVYFVDNTGKYETKKIYKITVISDFTYLLGDQAMLLSSIGNPPSPTGFSLHYNIASGQVTLTWNKVNVADMLQYVIYRRIETGALTIDTILHPKTSFTDIVFTKATDTGDHLCTYQIFSEDSTHHRSDPPAGDTITAISPFKTGTFISMHAVPSVNTSVDSTAINDSVKIALEFSNKYFQVRNLYWSVGKPDSVIKTSTLTSNTGKDTLRTIFKQTGSKPIYVKAVDENGQTRMDSLIIQVVQDSPKINYLTSNMSIDFQTSFQCSVSVSHRFGSCSLYVDLNHDGKFEVKRKGLIFDTTVVTNLDTAWGKVRIHVTDSHGNFLDTNFIVTIKMPNKPHWEPCSRLTYSRRWLSTCVIKDKLYAIGGLRKYIKAGSTRPTSRAASYVEALDSVWTPLDSMKIGRYGFALGVYNDSAYVFGGMGFQGATKSIEKFDPASRTWTLLSDTMPFYRTGAASCVIGTKLYLFGGRIDDISDSVCNSIYSFDFTTKRWLELSNHMNSRRSDFQAVNIRDKIYLIGGWDDAGNVLSDVEIFDTATQQCISGIAQSMPMPRYDYAAVSFKDSIYVIGGCGNTNGDLYSDIYRFSPLTNAWSQATTFPDPDSYGMYGMGACVVNGAIVIVGGSSTHNGVDDPGFASSLVRKYYP